MFCRAFLLLFIFVLLYSIKVVSLSEKGEHTMTKWQKFWFFLYLRVRYGLPESIRNIRRRIWNKRLKLWWYRLFVRKDEFHHSLQMDLDALLVMDDDEKQAYLSDLQRRRTIAHRRSLV